MVVVMVTVLSVIGGVTYGKSFDLQVSRLELCLCSKYSRCVGYVNDIMF